MSCVHPKEVCRVFDVDEAQLVRWGYRGYLRSQRDGNYSLAELNVFLARYGQQGVLTWQRLQRYEDAMLSSSSMQRMFDLSEAQIDLLLQRFPLSHARFPGKALRYSALATSSVLSAMRRGAVRADIAARALGYDGPADLRSLRAIEFALIGVSRSAQGAKVAPRGFWRYMREQLPDWIDPYEWFGDCEAVREPLLPAEQVASMLSVPPKHLHQKLQRDRAAFIVKRNANRNTTVMVSPVWVWGQMRVDTPLFDRQVACLLGVTPQAVSFWRQHGRLVCPLGFHTHQKSEAFLRSCWTSYLLQNCSPELVEAMPAYIEAQLSAQEPTPLFSTGTVARLYGYSTGTLREWIDKGALLAIRTPGGEYRMTPSWLRRVGIDLAELS